MRAQETLPFSYTQSSHLFLHFKNSSLLCKVDPIEPGYLHFGSDVLHILDK